ncbi:MAG: zinc-dependent metalloprotease [Candidatus Cryptobacteroides sp.]|nr:zinc-dependent metalloprotease [Candidatus Cryptobacteroides sp.]
MTKRSIILTLIAAALLVPSTDVAASVFKKKKKKAQTEATAAQKPAPKKKQTPYEKLMKEVADSACGGTFNLYRTSKDKIYMGFPRNMMGRRMLVGSTITATSNPAYLNVGYKYVKPTYFQIDLKDSLVVLSVPGANATSSDPGMQTALERSYIPKVLRRIAVQATSKDSSEVIFEVTPLINSVAPKGKNFSLTKAADEKSTWFSDLKAFSDNASVKVHSNVDFTKTFLMLKGKVGSGSMAYTVSFMLLPENPMPARVQDSRIGVFPVGPGEGSVKYNLTSAEDGFKGYVLASRWRLELSDTTAWKNGQKVTVRNPIVWYVDNSFPEAWKAPIKEGVLAWNKAFEAIGLKDVMQVRDFPTAEEDPQFDPDNLKYSCIRYVPDATMNAMGPSWVDPVTGEILNASVLVYNDVIKLINNWRFVQTAQVDEKVRAVKMPQDIIDESMVYVISHEIGHTLGLMHNMGASSAYPTDSLRNAAFTAKYGTTPSIMDYARFNYVAQPGDKGVRLVPPTLGVYDEYAIKWLYTPVPGAKDIWEEAEIAGKIIEAKAGDPLYRYGAQQMATSAAYGSYDPSARTEDLGDDPIKSSDYGIRNLKYILPRMNEWIGADDEDFTHRGDLYTQLTNQYYRYIGNVMAQVGGIYLNNVKDGSAVKPSVPVARKVQRASLKWVVAQLRSSSWINEPSVTSNLPLAAPQSNKICAAVAKSLASTVPTNVMLSSAVPGVAGPYTVKEYYDDLYAEVFASSIAGRRLSSEEKTLQREVLTASSKDVKSVLSKSFAEETEADEHLGGQDWCGFEDHSLGEGQSPFQKAVSVQTIDESDGCRIIFLNKVKALCLYRRSSAPSEDRAHYEYLLARVNAALQNQK